MKAKDARRAAILVRARGELSEQIDLLVKPPIGNYDWRGLEVQVCDFEEDGEDANILNPYTRIDAETALIALPAIIAVIDDELKKLGVTIDEEGADEAR